MTKINIPKGWHRHPDGGGLVQDTAFVAETAYVGPDAKVSGNAKVLGNARVFGNAKVFGNARVFDNAWVSGNARVFGNARALGNTKVFGNAWVSGNARVLDYTKVYGNARVLDYTKVSGNAWVSDYALVSGNARINRGNHVVSPLVIQGTRDTLCYLGEDWVAIGCEEHPVSEWLEDYQQIGEKHEYSESEIEEYRKHLISAFDWIMDRLEIAS